MVSTENINTFLNFMKLKDGTPIISVDFLDWLVEKGFFDKPASVKWHGTHSGGLFDHSITVAESLVSMTNKLGLSWQNERSPYIVGMFHDLCKVDEYINEHSGTDLEPKWNYNNDKVIKGHGDKSVMLLSQFINLTEEELYCIRFHMGAYITDDWDSYDKAIKTYETVLWTHTADMYASKVAGI